MPELKSIDGLDIKDLKKIKKSIEKYNQNLIKHQKNIELLAVRNKNADYHFYRECSEDGCPATSEIPHNLPRRTG